MGDTIVAIFSLPDTGYQPSHPGQLSSLWKDLCNLRVTKDQYLSGMKRQVFVFRKGMREIVLLWFKKTQNKFFPNGLISVYVVTEIVYLKEGVLYKLHIQNF